MQKLHGKNKFSQKKLFIYQLAVLLNSHGHGWRGGCGAGISKISPASNTALCVVAPKAAMRVLFCLKSGKFCITIVCLTG